jgi:glycosyltransferase involved in cell wall biosynthesis
VRPFLASVELAVSPNGVFADDYSTRAVAAASPSIGFLGNMGYAPNIAAVRRLREIHRRARETVPDLKLYVIGRNPTPEVLEYARDEGVVVTGAVDSIWEYINAVDVFVLPIHSGTGQQNKLLEVLFAGRATISTRIANAGVGARDGESVLIADDDDSTLRQILALLADPAWRRRLGEAGARFVRSRFGWDSIAAQYIELIGAAADTTPARRSSEPPAASPTPPRG